MNTRCWVLLLVGALFNASLATAGQASTAKQNVAKQNVAKQRAATKAPQKAPAATDPRLHAIGGLAAVNLYNTFGCIGLAADGYAAKAFDADQVQNVMHDVLKTTDIAVEMLKAAKGSKQPLSPRFSYDDLIDCYDLVEREARFLMAAAKSKDAQAMQAFRQSREASWAKISQVLGIEKPAKKPAQTGAKK